MSKVTHKFKFKSKSNSLLIFILIIGCVFSMNVSLLANNFQKEGENFLLKKLRFLQEEITASLKNVTDELTLINIENTAAFFAPCPGGAGVIGGEVFGDFNYNGLNDQSSNIEGVEVFIYACDGSGDEMLVSSEMTDQNGTYFFGGLTDGIQYRLEFIPPAFLDYNEGMSGADAGASVQFVTAPSCGINASFANPEDYCQPNPGMAASCFLNGDPLPLNSEANDKDVLVFFNWEDEGNSDLPEHLANAGQIGATYGIGYDRDNQDLYVSAFIKRFVGMGPLGLGGIYKVGMDFNNPTNSTVSEFLDVESIGIDVGSIPSNAGRGLPTILEDPSNDSDAYGKVGKEGIGALGILDNKIWFVNLFDKNLYSIVIDSDNNDSTAPDAGDVESFPLPAGPCTAGELRPFALKVFRGKVYIGAVCDASISDGPEDLLAVVYRLDGNSFTEITQVDLTYDKGYAASANNCDFFSGWYAWLDDITLPPTCDANVTYVYPQPVLTDIEFDIDGSMILGLMDRTGHQLGNKNWPLTGTTPLMTNISGGDMLRVDFDNGVYTVESNGTAGGATTAGAGNSEGPGGGEFYYQDIFAGPSDNFLPPPHAETAQGDLAFYAGAGEVATTALDPYSTLFNSGGINYMNNSTGEVQLPGYVLYRTSTSSISSFSKANGLGSIVVMCDNDPPSEMGGYLWQDANSNGIQDPCETALANINVGLFDNAGNLLATVITDAFGQYYFNDNETPIDINTTYHIVAGTGGQFDITNGELNGTYFLTFENIGGGQTPDRTDSDGTLATTQSNNAFTGMPSIEVTTGNFGFIDHSLDFGFASLNVNPVGGIGGFVWDDTNKDGIEDGGELGIGGVSITIFDENDNFVGMTQSNSDGSYFLPNISLGNYYLLFDATNNDNGITNYEGSPQNQGDGTNDSDADPVTGETAVFAFDPVNGNNNEIDAGFLTATGTFSGLVWDDINEDGIQDGGEGGLEGITVNLINSDNGMVINTTTSGSDGSYSFTGIENGNYILEFDAFTNAANIPNLIGSPQNQGDGSNDSDPNANTGQTSIIVFDTNNGNLINIDAGFIEPMGTIGGLVFEDLNENGLLDFGEPSIEGVTVSLFDNNSGLQVGSATTTAADGSYAFDDIVLGNYYLVFDETTNVNGVTTYVGTLQNAGNDAIDSDANPNTGQTDVYNFDPEVSDLSDVSAGFFTPTSSVGGSVWSDTNSDGILNNGETGIGGVTVTLFDDMGMQLGQIVSNSDGSYSFDGFPAGDYFIVFDPSSTGNPDYEFSPQNQGGNDNIDSDADPNDGMTPVFTFNPIGGPVNNISAGLTLPFGTVGNFVFLDCNGNGIQDNGENGIPNVPVLIEGTTVSNNALSLNVLTDNNGFYQFANIEAGNYVVTVSMPIGLIGIIYTTQDVGLDDAIDSDVDSITGETNPFILAGGDLLTIDAGFQDVVAPVFANAPADETLPCDDPNFDTPPTLIATDNYDNDVTIDFQETMDGMGTGCDGGLMVTRTWTATDDCGNSTVHTQIISTGDELSPIIINIPDLTVECDSNIIDVVKAVDDCDPNPNLTWVDIETTGACPTLIIREWTATDLCGNVTVNTQKVTLEDTTPPEITFTNPLLDGVQNGGSVTLECDEADTITGDDGEVADSCDPDVELIFSETSEEGVCQDDGYFLKRTLTWYAEDNCGNFTEITIMVFIVDTTPPMISVPDDMTVDCNSIPPVPTPVISDNCDDDPFIDFEEIILGDTCEAYKIVRSWLVMDECLNMAWAQQKIIVEVDNLEIHGVPEDITIECDEDKPTPANVTASNDCSSTNVEYQELFIDGDCSQKCIRVWTATDECGHEEIGTQLITIVDTTAPEIEFTHPALVGLMHGDSLEFNCDEAIVFDENDAAATDNCQEPELTFMEMQDIGDCLIDGYLLRMECCWKADDGCGNLSELCIIIRIIDDKKPQIEGIPADVTINQAFEEIPDPSNVTATDNCDDEVNIDLVESQIANPDNCGYTLIRTWIATDDCGNSCSDSQTITVEDVCDCPNILVNNVTVGNATCGQGNGSFSVEMAIDPTIYNYLLLPNIGTQSADGNSFSNLPAGSYILVINLPDFDDCDEKIFFDILDQNCTDTLQGIVMGETEICIDEQYLDFEGIITSSEIIQSGDANEVWASSIDNNCVTFQSNGNFFGLSNTLIGVVNCFNGSVNQCDTTYFEITVEPEPLVCELVVDMVEIQPLDCDGNLGMLEVSVSGNIGNLNYNWNPNVSNTNAASDLAAGSYEVTVTDEDTGCTASTNFTLLAVPTVSLELSNLTVQNISCNGLSDGEISSNMANEFTISNGNGVIGVTPVADLPLGTYTVYHTNGICNASLDIEITEPTAMTATITTTPEGCADNDATISLTVTGGTGNYTYTWSSNVSNSAIATGLNAATTYAVTIEDENDCQIILDNLTVEDACPPCTLAVAVANQSDETCGLMDGEIQLVANDPNGTVTYQWDPMISSSNMAFGLSAGTYNITATDAQGCESSIAVEIVNIQPIWAASATIIAETCTSDDGNISINIDNVSGNYFFNWSPNVSSSNIAANLDAGFYSVTIQDGNGCEQILNNLEVEDSCNPCLLELSVVAQSNEICSQSNGSIQLDTANAIGIVTYDWNPAISNSNTATGLAAGVYSITATDENNCQAVAVVEIENDQPQWQAIVNITNETCVGNNGTIDITVSGAGTFTYLWTPDLTDQNLLAGLNNSQVFEVLITDENGCTLTLTDLQVGLDCTPIMDSSNEFLACGVVNYPLCVSTAELPGFVQGVTVCEQPVNGTLGFLNDTCFTYTPNVDFFGLDTVCLLTCDDNNICDTTLFYIEVEECMTNAPCEDFIPGGFEYVMTEDCGADGKVCIKVELSEMLNMAVTDNGVNYMNGFEGCQNDTSFSYNYFTIPQNGNVGPYSVMWDINGNNFSGAFTDLNDLIVQMNGWDANGNWVMNVSTGNIEGGSGDSTYGTLEVQQTATGAFANLELNTNITPTATELTLTQGLHELIFTNADNCNDTLNFEVICIESEIVYDTILLGNSGMTCITGFELPGTPQTPQMVCNDCSQIDFEWDGNCLRYDGILEGTADIVLILCDDLGFCDTTYLFVTVENTGELPDANIDADSTQINNSVITDMLANDIINGTLESLTITVDPEHGIVTLNNDNTITYQPDANYCGLDAYAYEICNQNGCDETTVNILIDCMTPNVMQGFSPNGDGINDGFHIENLESYPNNQLTVYDRWGNFVYKADNYQSDWKGTYRSTNLPDGTYFYVLKYGKGNVMSGYVHLRR